MILHKISFFRRNYSFDMELTELDQLLRLFLTRGWKYIKGKDDSMPLDSIYYYSFTKGKKKVNVVGDSEVVNIVINRRAFRELRTHIVSAIEVTVNNFHEFNHKRTLKFLKKSETEGKLLS